MGRPVLLVGTGEIIPIKQEIIPIKLAKVTTEVDISILSRVQSIRIFHPQMITIQATTMVQVKHLHLRMVTIIRET